MGRIRKVAAIAVLCVVAASYGTTAPAQAETLKTESLEGLARSAGLNLKLGTTDLTLGFAESTVDATLATAQKTLSAVGKGAGQLLSGSEVLTKAPTLAGLLTDSKPQACLLDIPLPALLRISAACGISSSSVQNDLPISSAAGHVADIRLLGDGPLGQLLNSLGTSLAGLTGTLDGILGAASAPAAASAADSGLLGGLLGDLGAVDALIPGLGGTGALTGALDTLLDSLLGGTALSSLIPDPVVVSVGTSTSLVKTELSKVTSTAESAGIDVKLLPVAGIPLLANGLVHLVIGEASTTAVLDRVTGVSTANFNAANLLRLDVLGISVPISPNLDINLPGILRVVLGKGTVQNTAAGAIATATGASLDVLNGLVKLSLATAESSVGGVLKLVDVPQVLNRVEQPRELPRTGADGPLLALLGGGILVIAVVTRRAVLRTR